MAKMNFLVLLRK